MGTAVNGNGRLFASSLSGTKYCRRHNSIDRSYHTAKIVQIRLPGVTAAIEETFQYLINQGDRDMEGLVEVRRTPTGMYEALVQWTDFSDSECSWELLPNIYANAPNLS